MTAPSCTPDRRVLPRSEEVDGVMLDAFVIEEIRRRERERGRDYRPGIQVPLPVPVNPTDEEKPADDEKPAGGVIIIDYGRPA